MEIYHLGNFYLHSVWFLPFLLSCVTGEIYGNLPVLDPATRQPRRSSTHSSQVASLSSCRSLLPRPNDQKGAKGVGRWKKITTKKWEPQPTGCCEIYPVLREFFVCNAMHCCTSPWKCLFSPNQPRSTKKLLVFASESSKTKSSLKLGDTSSLWSRCCNEKNEQIIQRQNVGTNGWEGHLQIIYVDIFTNSTMYRLFVHYIYIYFIYIHIWLGLYKARWGKRNVQY